MNQFSKGKIITIPVMVLVSILLCMSITPACAGFPQFCNDLPAGTPVAVPGEVRDSWNSQIVTDEELIYEITTRGTFPGVNKSVVVVINESETHDALSISASVDGGVIITRSPFTTRGTLEDVLATSSHVSADRMEVTEGYLSEDDAAISDPKDCPFYNPGTSLKPGTPMIGNTQYAPAGFHISTFDAAYGMQYQAGGFTGTTITAAIPAKPATPYAVLQISSSALSPFNSPAQTGDAVESLSGIKSGSGFTYYRTGILKIAARAA